MNHSTGKPTQAQQARLDALSSWKCVACDMQHVVQPLRTEIHHLVDRGTRRASGGHDATLPLDSWHHRGILLPGYTTEQMRAEFGPSLALHKREFVATYGTERQLLQMVDAVLELTA